MPSASLLANPHLMCRERLPSTRIAPCTGQSTRLKNPNVMVDHVIQVYVDVCDCPCKKTSLVHTKIEINYLSPAYS